MRRPAATHTAAEVLQLLQAKSTPHDLANLDRFGIAAANPLGVSMANIQALAKQLGRSHSLALDLWQTACYEARLLASFVDEPALVTEKQMDQWCRDFDNWGICDTVCFKLLDQSPHAWKKVQKWSKKSGEFQKRAAFALLASLAGHDKSASDDQFLATFPLIQAAASDDRNFVRKGVSWALRRIGLRSAHLRVESERLAQALSESSNDAARWIGRDALREFSRYTAKRSKT